MAELVVRLGTFAPSGRAEQPVSIGRIPSM